MEHPGQKCTHSVHHSEAFKAELISRLNRIRGQLGGISRMIEEDVYCDDVLNQISSVTAAISGVKRKLLEAHIRTCVVEQLQEGREEVVDELMTTIKKMV